MKIFIGNVCGLYNFSKEKLGCKKFNEMLGNNCKRDYKKEGCSLCNKTEINEEIIKNNKDLRDRIIKERLNQL